MSFEPIDWDALEESESWDEWAARHKQRAAERLSAVFTEKYAATHDYKPAPTQWDEGGLWSIRPRVAFAWSEFPKTLTRFRFDRS